MAALADAGFVELRLLKVAGLSIKQDGGPPGIAELGRIAGSGRILWALLMPGEMVRAR